MFLCTVPSQTVSRNKPFPLKLLFPIFYHSNRTLTKTVGHGGEALERKTRIPYLSALCVFLVYYVLSNLSPPQTPRQQGGLTVDRDFQCLVPR